MFCGPLLLMSGLLLMSAQKLITEAKSIALQWSVMLSEKEL